MRATRRRSILGGFRSPNLARGSTLGLALGMALGMALGSTLGCRDHEQSARAHGAQARVEVTAACDPTLDPARDPGLDPEATEGPCFEQRCRSACDRHGLPPSFANICVEECRQRGVCTTNADCRAGRTCVAIAPRVRRCEASDPASP